MEKNKVNYTPTKNKLNEETDYTYQEKLNDSIIERNRDSSADEQKVAFKRSTKLASHVLWADDCDIQSGGQGYTYDRHKAAVDMVMSCWNVIYGIGGDMHDNANKNSATDVFGNRITPSQSITAMEMLYSEYKDKISFIISGDHDWHWGSRLSSTNLSMTKHTADILGVDHIPFGLIYQLPILTPDTLEEKYMNVLVQHNAKGGKHTVTDNSLKLMELAAAQGIKIDIIQTEHMHTGSEGVYTIPLPKYDENGARVGDINHRVFVINGKTWQNTNTTYGSVMGFGETKTNLKVVDLSWKLNPYYTENKKNMEPKYIPQAVSFSVLKNDSLEPSQAMSKYMNFYKMDEMTRYKNSLKRKDLPELIKLMESMEVSFEKAKKLLIAKNNKKTTKAKPRTKQSNNKEEVVKEKGGEL